MINPGGMLEGLYNWAFGRDGIDARVRALESAPGFSPTQITSGRWTPTLTNTTNIDTTTPHECQYLRINDEVIVSGVVEIDATALGAVVMKMSLPIASAFAVTEDASGNVGTPGANQVIGSIIPDVGLDLLDFRLNALVTTNVFYRFVAVYRIK